MNLSQILLQLPISFKIFKDGIAIDQKQISQLEIKDVALNSNLIVKDSVFFAIRGQKFDGFNFIIPAIENGAKVIVIDETKEINNITIAQDIIIIKTPDVAEFLKEFLVISYNNLAKNIYTVTGTNGKSSVADFGRQILQFLGKKSAAIGTLGVTCDSEIKQNIADSSLTTPDIISLYKNLEILQKNHIDDVFLEASSIALDQKRLAGLNIDCAIFTNFSQDHLDYHQSMQNYLDCKTQLFENVISDKATAILNSDIEQYNHLRKACEKRNLNIIDYGFKAKDLKLLKITQNNDCQQVDFIFNGQNYQFLLNLKGQFQVFNILAALAAILAKNQLNHEELCNLLQKFVNLKAVNGRMQLVTTLKNNAEIFIDFAHSPDSLKNVLELARKITKNRVIILFGCGGDRDIKKRPLMAKIANELADFTIVTDDNPRHENAAQIRSQIMQHCDISKTIEVAGRKEAITKAINILQPDDILILAGKGHEKYQIIKDQKIEFDEEKIVKNVVKQLS